MATSRQAGRTSLMVLVSRIARESWISGRATKNTISGCLNRSSDKLVNKETDHGARGPNNLLQQTAALLSVSRSIMPSRPPLLSFGVRPWQFSLLQKRWGTLSCSRPCTRRLIPRDDAPLEGVAHPFGTRTVLASRYQGPPTRHKRDRDPPLQVVTFNHGARAAAVALRTQSSDTQHVLRR